MITAVARAITRGSSLVKSLTFGGDVQSTIPVGRVRSSTSLRIPSHRPAGPQDPRHAWVAGGCGRRRFPVRPCRWRFPPSDRDPRAPPQALEGAPGRHRRRGGPGDATPLRPARRWRRPRRPRRRWRPPWRPRRSRSRCPSRCGPRWPRRWAARRSRSGRCRCSRPSRCGPTCTRPPSSRRPPASSPRSRRAALIYKSAACSGCHGAGGGGQRQRPGPHRGARDLARLPRPHDVGAARHRSAGRSSPTPTAPPTSRSSGGDARPRRPRRRGAGARRALRAGRVRRPGGGLGGVRAAPRDRRGHRPPSPRPGLGELSAAAGVPEDDLAAG